MSIVRTLLFHPNECWVHKMHICPSKMQEETGVRKKKTTRLRCLAKNFKFADVPKSQTKQYEILPGTHIQAQSTAHIVWIICETRTFWYSDHSAATGIFLMPDWRSSEGAKGREMRARVWYAVCADTETGRQRAIRRQKLWNFYFINAGQVDKYVLWKSHTVAAKHRAQAMAILWYAVAFIMPLPEHIKRECVSQRKSNANNKKAPRIVPRLAVCNERCVIWRRRQWPQVLIDQTQIAQASYHHRRSWDMGIC